MTDLPAPPSAQADRYEIVLVDRDAELVALEPTSSELADALPDLARFYNEPHNRARLGHTSDMSESEVAEFYVRARERGDRPFLLLEDRRVVGDADLRAFGGGSAEFAILIGPRAEQGRGLGRRIASMLHAFAFEVLGLSRIYVTILPDNTASLRLFTALGHTLDTSPEARAHADDPSDVSMSVTPATLQFRTTPEIRKRAFREGL